MTPIEAMQTAVRAKVSEEKEQFAGFLTARELLDRPCDRAPDIIGQGILPEGAGMILAGPSGVGKSLLRTEISARLALGADLWGLPVCKPQTVLIVQFENPVATEQARLRRMLTGLGHGSIRIPTGLMFASPRERFDIHQKKDRQRLEDMVSASGAQIVCYDPLSSLHSANENDNGQMRQVLDSLTVVARRTNSTTILLHHFGKPNQDGQTPAAWQFRGASSIRDWADTFVNLTRKPHENRILVELTFTKIRNGADRRPILLERDKETFLHSPVQEDALVPSDRVAAVLECLGGTVAKQVNLVDALIQEMGCSEKTARVGIQTAVGHGLIQESWKGKFKGYILSQGHKQKID